MKNNEILRNMQTVFEDREIGELQGDPSLSIFATTDTTRSSLKECIEGSLEEAISARYENKAEELSRVLQCFDHADIPTEIINGLRKDIEKKRPLIL